MKKIFIVITLLFAVFAFAGCDFLTEVSSDSQMQKQTEESMKEAQSQIGYPAITNFQEKKLVSWIYELRDREDLICHAYLVSSYTGQVGQYIGKCIGYGIPYSVQFSNPDKIVNRFGESLYRGSGMNSYTPIKVSQPEPNGLFMPSGLKATWLIRIHPKTGDPCVQYIESDIFVSPFPIH